MYRKHSILNLCQESRRFKWGARKDHEGYDLWKHLKGLVNAVNDGDPEYGIMGYNGGLFDDTEERFLGKHKLRNDYRPVKATRLLPAVRFSGLRQDSGTGKAIFYVQRLVTFAVVVKNPNRETLTIRRVEVLTPDAEVKAFTAACIAEGEERSFSVSCLFNGSARGKEELVLHIAYEIAGDERAVELKTAAEFKSALTTGLNLKDLV